MLSERIFLEDAQGELIADTPHNRLIVRGWAAMTEELVISWRTDPGEVTRDELLGDHHRRPARPRRGACPRRSVSRPCMASPAGARRPSLTAGARSRVAPSRARRTPSTRRRARRPRRRAVPERRQRRVRRQPLRHRHRVDAGRPIPASPPTSRSARRRRSPRPRTGAPLSSFSFDLEGLTVDRSPSTARPRPFAGSTDAAHDEVQAGRHARHPGRRRVHDRRDLQRHPGLATPTPTAPARAGDATSDGVDLPEPAGRLDDRVPQQQHAERQGDVRHHARHPDHDHRRRVRRGRQRRAARRRPPVAGRTTWVWEQQEPMASDWLAHLDRPLRHVDHRHRARQRSDAQGVELRRPDRARRRRRATAARANLKTLHRLLRDALRRLPRQRHRASWSTTSRRAAGINYALETQDRPFFPDSVGDATIIHETDAPVVRATTCRRRSGTTSGSARAPATYAEASTPTRPADLDDRALSTTSGTPPPPGSATWTTPAADP